MTKKAKSRLIIIIALAFLAASILFLIYSLFYPFNSRENLDLAEKVRNEAISANVLLVVVMEESGTTQYSAGHSGVIYKRDGNNYYILTALHGISFDLEITRPRIIVLGYDQPTYNEYIRTGEAVGFSRYYSQFSEAGLEYSDVAYDLAVVSFYSENEYMILPISAELPEYNEPVAAIGNPHGNSRNIITTGRISSRNPVPFDIDDGRIQHNVIEHTAEISDGNSGGALLNEEMEIVGINLSSTRNLLQRFVKSAAMPCDKILEFLNDMEKYLR
jgi:S1-C subfamily serine protease